VIERTADAVVVGAGPAGAATAVTLARAGLDVVVVDRARFPRDKTCGDGLTASALRHLGDLGVEPADVASWTVVDRVGLRAPDGRVIDLALPGDGVHAAVARRADVDAALVRAARAAGAEVHEASALASVATGPDGVVVGTDKVSLRAPYLVAADGAWSPTRKLVAPERSGPGYLGDWHAMRQYLTNAGPDAGSRLWVWFEPDLLPGYAWSFPLPGRRVNFGFGFPRTPGVRSGEMAATWRALIGRPHIRAVLGPDARPEAPVRAWPIPARADPAALTAAGGRALFAGDAARLADPMTGEGIGQALESGIAAARAVLSAGPARPGLAATSYATEITAGIGVDNRLASALSRVLGRSAGANAAMRLAGLSPWTRANFARWMWEDYPRAVLATPRRWRRGMLAPPAAFGVSDR